MRIQSQNTHCAKVSLKFIYLLLQKCPKCIKLGFVKFVFFVMSPFLNLQLHTKFRQNQIIHS